MSEKLGRYLKDASPEVFDQVMAMRDKPKLTYERKLSRERRREASRYVRTRYYPAMQSRGIYPDDGREWHEHDELKRVRRELSNHTLTHEQHKKSLRKSAKMSPYEKQLRKAHKKKRKKAVKLLRKLIQELS